MLKILSTNQIRELDAYTIKHRPIDSIDLMENACRAIFNWFTENYNVGCTIGIICGTGNNGGDGLGVARMLEYGGYNVRVWIIQGSMPESADFKINLERLADKVEVAYITDNISPETFQNNDVLVDAIFGSGLSRPPEGIYAAVINCVNELSIQKIAIDIPSGLMADVPSEGAIIRAKYTLAFQVPKLAFLFPDHFAFVGNWVLLDIGLHKEFLKKVETPYFYFVKKDVRKILRVRSKFDHKGKFGHALLVAGAYGKMGAAVLAARAALRSGLGLLTVHVPRSGYNVIQSSVPEAMASIDDHQDFFSSPPSLSSFTVIGIGPGLGVADQTVRAFQKMLMLRKIPFVIDADALNILAENRDFLQSVPEGSILTPHPKEFERLVGEWKNEFERLEKQQKLAKDLKSVVILKGANTSIAAPDGTVYFNSSGNPGMAKGGCGDVLTGILTGLMAQQYSALEAAQLGVFLHGFAGDLAAYETGMNSLIASDVTDLLPEAFKRAG
ncbi:MAG TPA: NAD(P)H-hydrate dehydratase [Chryseolinea sp.]|jgi:NAD(P)H-hydrate epimerase|nr:NAD(P)H-hydrate dehydratase [Chryseolinea sp.]